VKISLPK